jgi:hypothetical protein
LCCIDSFVDASLRCAALCFVILCSHFRRFAPIDFASLLASCCVIAASFAVAVAPSLR